ncbi:hypothetical protein P154DRAFT_346574 [Amniculicola lignicola CBS 123094]|uniref:Uncharacterized protein n=1 Tax=Amniculicola lignicola CBS 123094 TaxID=1392246 RepID=A0A6A5W2A7_9PLEO|nr:hypothetical protein P154DRAFT_346574 [Amniculicola lignicola CBS 123094]
MEGRQNMWYHGWGYAWKTRLAPPSAPLNRKYSEYPSPRPHLTTSAVEIEIEAVAEALGVHGTVPGPGPSPGELMIDESAKWIPEAAARHTKHSACSGLLSESDCSRCRRLARQDPRFSHGATHVVSETATYRLLLAEVVTARCLFRARLVGSVWFLLCGAAVTGDGER